jgi:hypothetical protein
LAVAPAAPVAVADATSNRAAIVLGLALRRNFASIVSKTGGPKVASSERAARAAPGSVMRVELDDRVGLS